MPPFVTSKPCGRCTRKIAPSMTTKTAAAPKRNRMPLRIDKHPPTRASPTRYARAKGQWCEAANCSGPGPANAPNRTALPWYRNAAAEAILSSKSAAAICFGPGVLLLSGSLIAIPLVAHFTSAGLSCLLGSGFRTFARPQHSKIYLVLRNPSRPLVGDPLRDARMQHVQRQSSCIQDFIMKGADVILRAEVLLRLFTQFEDLHLA